MPEEENINPDVPEGMDDAAPTLPDEGSDPQGGAEGDGKPAPPEPDATATRLQTLEKELAEAKKRISGQTRSWQQTKSEYEKAQEQLSRYQKYDDVIKALEDEQDGDNKPTPQQKPQIDQQLNNRLGSLEIKLLKSEFASKNPEKAFVLHDPDLDERVDAAAVKIMQQEIAEYGSVVSKPEELMSHAVEKTIALVNRFREEGVKSVTEKRTKISGTAADLKGKERPSPPSDDEDTPMTKEDYFRSEQEYRDKIRNLR